MKIPINPFHATDLFWYLLKTSDVFSDVFIGLSKKISGMKWVKDFCNFFKDMSKPVFSIRAILSELGIPIDVFQKCF